VQRDLFARRTATIVISTCAAIVAGTVFALAVPGWRRALGLTAADGVVYPVGDRIDVPVSLYESGPVTLLLFTRSSCGTCQRAKSALAALTTALRDRGTVRVTMVVADGTQADEGNYLHDIGLTAGHLAAVDFRTLRLQRVPTTVLVDRTGHVLYSLEGEPTASDQMELLRLASARDLYR
jgi:hypothetical protein